jgi:hypothetical protein
MICRAAGLYANQPSLNRHRYCFRPVSYVKLEKDVFQETFGGVFGDVQDVRNLFVRQPFGQFVKDLQFTRG